MHKLDDYSTVTTVSVDKIIIITLQLGTMYIVNYQNFTGQLHLSDKNQSTATSHCYIYTCT